MKKTALIPVVLAGVCLLYSCGYTVRSGILQDIRSINVALFENETYEHALEVDLARELSREFIVDGGLSVSDLQTADVRIAGTIREYVLEPHVYGDGEADVEQYLLRIKAEVILESIPGGEIIWKEDVIDGETTYHVEGVLARTEEEARNDAIRDLSRRIVRRTVGAW